MQINKINLLLINPWIYDFTAFDLWSKPLGLLYLASFLRDCGFNIAFIDCLESKAKIQRYGTGNYNREIIDKPEILRHIPRHFARYGISEDVFLKKLHQIPEPSAILVTSIMTYWYPGVQRVVEILRNHFPGRPIILGGIYATLMPEHARKTVRPDYLITGPGEEKVLKLLTDILEIDTSDYYFPANIDDLPLPAFDLYENLDYLIVMTARGCPFDCSFCAQKKISMPFTQRNPHKVINEIVQNYQKYKIRDFAFYDDALFINPDKHIKVILKGIINAKIPVRLHSPNGLFAGFIDQELAELMYKANFKTVRLSFETANENRHKDMNNKISNQGMKQAVRLLTGAGYSAKQLDAYVIMGLPGQDLEEVLASMVFVNDLGVQIRLASYSPIPGTRDFMRAVASQQIQSDIDPLLTNKSVFPLRASENEYNTYINIRVLSHLLNNAAEKGLRLFTDPRIGPGLKKVIGAV